MWTSDSFNVLVLCGQASAALRVLAPHGARRLFPRVPGCLRCLAARWQAEYVRQDCDRAECLIIVVYFLTIVVQLLKGKDQDYCAPDTETSASDSRGGGSCSRPTRLTHSECVESRRSGRSARRRLGSNNTWRRHGKLAFQKRYLIMQPNWFSK